MVAGTKRNLLAQTADRFQSDLLASDGGPPAFRKFIAGAGEYNHQDLTGALRAAVDMDAPKEYRPTVVVFVLKNQGRLTKLADDLAASVAEVGHVPALIIDGFFDVESRGAFEGYSALRDDGAHMIVVGAHDGAPQGTDAGVGKMNAWVDRYLRGIDNGVEREPRVQMLMSDGDREDYLAGDYVRAEGDDWPLPGTKWEPLALDAKRAGSAASINDGSLSLERPASSSLQPFAAIPSLPTNTDVPTAAIIGAAGFNSLSTAFPILTDMTAAGALGLSYTTPALKQDVTAAGPLSLELPLISTAPESAIWGVISDVDANGTPHPLAVGRLSTAFPDVIASESRTDPASGDIVQPYGDYSNRKPATPGAERRYAVEFWPVGNRFKKGHRIRLDIVGASAFSVPTAPAVNTVRVGGDDGARLLFPVLPGSDLRAALDY